MTKALTDLRHRLEYMLLLLIVGLVRLPPLEIATAISAWCWQRIAPYGKRQRRALANIARAFPDMPETERRRIVMAMWGNLGRVMAETMQLDRIVSEPDRMQFLSQELFDRYEGKLGPAIGVTLHMGNWELATWPMAVAGWHPAAIYRLVKNPYVDRYIRRQRKTMFPGGLLAKGRASNTDQSEGQRTARQIMDFVRQGGRLGIVSDLYDHFGIEVPFFGHLAKSTPAPAMIARRVGSRIWIGRCVRIGTASRFQLEVKELKVQRSASTSEDIRATTAAIHQQFEAWIREYPEQWMWSNRRWS